jgi:hypothetical protein
MPSGPWFAVNQTTTQEWAQAGTFYSGIDEAKVRDSAKQAATHITSTMQDRIHRGPDTNGELASQLDFRDVASNLSAWDEEDNVYVGVPTKHPVSDKAAWMEFGDEDQPPTPVMFSALHDDGVKQKVVETFHQQLASK